MELTPNFTQIPNIILDTIHTRTLEENILLIAICRKTYGWHKNLDKISLSQLQKITGMSRPTVIKYREKLKADGWIQVGQDKKGNLYYSVLESKESTELTSKPDLPQVVNHIYRSSKPDLPQVVNGVDTQNKSTKETNKINSLNKGQTHTGSEHSTSDKETKVSLPKKQDMPLNANYSPSEEILNGIPSQYMPEHSEASQKPNSYYVQIYVKRYKAEHDNEAPYRLDTFALEDLWRQLDYSEEKFDRLIRNYRLDKFWKDKKITVQFLLKYKSICADWNKEPAPVQTKTAYNTRDYNSPEYKAAVENIRKAAENRQNGAAVPFKKKTIKEIMDERKAKEAQEKLKHAV